MLVYAAAFVVLAASLTILAKVVDTVRSLSSRQQRCPRCHNSFSLKRTPRSQFDRFLGRLIESRRYQCLVCRWSGLLREESAPLSAAPSPFTSADLPILHDVQQA